MMIFVFTFHNVSINSRCSFQCFSFFIHLHSIMYLLILRFCFALMSCSRFTFHNVSINSQRVFTSLISLIDLHSIMYLLIRIPGFGGSSWGFKFTFHNVSINSVDALSKFSGVFNLHSIMYLLIQDESPAMAVRS